MHTAGVESLAVDLLCPKVVVHFEAIREVACGYARRVFFGGGDVGG